MDIDFVIIIIENMFDKLNLSDIYSIISVRCKKFKLLKIFIMKGIFVCVEFFKVIEIYLNRRDLI